MINVKKLLVFLLGVFLPSQVSYHWWPEWTLINGIKIDYLSPTLYLTDIILAFLILINFSHILLALRHVSLKIWIMIGVGLVINYSFSLFPEVTGWRLARLVWYSISGIILFRTWVENSPALIKGLTVSLIWTAILASLQFFSKGSLGGVWKYLGERPLYISNPTVAKIQIFDIGIFLRPYATLPHPNVLGAYLLVGGLLLLQWSRTNLSRFYRWCGWASIVFSLISFSRPIAFLVAICIGLWFFISNRRNILKVGVCAASILAIITWYITRLSHPNSWIGREQLIRQAIDIFASHPYWGVGLGGFIPAVSMYPFQPVHSLLLLSVAETGLVGLILVIGGMIYLSRLALKAGWWWGWSFAAILFTGAFDHYWFTLHQSILLLLIVITGIIHSSQLPKAQ